jgi:hypothetical protein
MTGAVSEREAEVTAGGIIASLPPHQKGTGGALNKVKMGAKTQLEMMSRKFLLLCRAKEA